MTTKSPARPDEHEGLPREGLLQDAGRPQDRDRGRDQEVVPQARPEVPPRREQGDAKAEERFKEISEAYNMLSDEKRRKEYDDARSMFGGGFRAPGRAAGRARAADSAGSTSAICSAADGDGGGLGDVSSAACSAAAAARTAQSRPRARRRRGDGDHAVVRRCDGRCHGGAAADRRGPVPGLPRHRRQGRHRAAGLPGLPGDWPAEQEPGRLRSLRAVQECRGRGLVVDDPCPVCPAAGGR